MFSIGVMLYQAVGETLPFMARTPGELLSQVIRCEPPPLPASVPRMLAQVVYQAMARDPAERYPSAEALADDLQRWLAGGVPRAAAASGVPGLVRQWLYRRRKVLALGLALLALLLAGVVYRATRPALLTLTTGQEGATVWIDGRRAGKTGPARPLELSIAPGRHRLRLESPRSFPVEQTVHLSAGRREVVTILLRRKTGVLFVSSEPPGASVFLGDGSKIIEATPGVAELTHGRYRIVVRKAGFRSVSETVDVLSGGRTSQFSTPLRSLTGVLDVTTQLDQLGLDVYPDGGDSRRPVRRMLLPYPRGSPPRLPPGFWRLRFSKGGYLTRELRTRLDSERPTRLLVNLPPILVSSVNLGIPLAGSLYVGDLDRSGTTQMLVGGRNGTGPVCLEYRRSIGAWRIRWDRTGRHPFWNTPILDVADVDGNGILDLLLNASTGSVPYLVAMSSLNGEILWQRRIQKGESASVAELEGESRSVVLLTGVRGGIRLLDGRTGRVRRTLAPASGNVLPPLVRRRAGGATGQLVTYGHNRPVSLIDPKSGATMAEAPLHTVKLALGDLDRNGEEEVVGVESDGRLTATGFQGGGPRWAVAPAGKIVLGPWLIGCRPGVLDAICQLDDGTVLAVDGRSGSQLWRSSALPRGSSGIACADWTGDGVRDPTFVSPLGRITVLDGQTGRTVWSHDLGAPLLTGFGLHDLDRDGLPEVYVAARDGRLFVVAPRIDQRWWLRLPRPLTDATFVEFQGRSELVVIDAGGMLRRVDPEEGQIRFEAQSVAAGGLPELCRSTPDLDSDGVGDVFVVGDRTVEARSGADGKQLWQRRFRDVRRVWDRPEDLDADRVPDPVVVLQAAGSAVAEALSGRNGRTLWRTVLGPALENWDFVPRGQPSPVGADLDGNGAIDLVVALPDGRCFALRGRDGKKLWSRSDLAPAVLTRRLACSPTPVDIDRDGRMDIALPSGFDLLLLRGGDGATLAKVRCAAWVRAPAQYVEYDGKPHLLVPTERSVTALAIPSMEKRWENRYGARLGPGFEGLIVRDLTGDGVADVLFGDVSSNLVLLEGRAGRPAWRYRSGVPLSARLLVSRDGRDVIVPGADQRLSAVRLRPAGDRADWSGAGFWRRFAGNDDRARRGGLELALLRGLLAELDSRYGSPERIRSAVNRYRKIVGRDEWCEYAGAWSSYHFSSGKGALVAVRRGLELNPDSARLRLLHARILFDRGHSVQAIAESNRVLQRASRSGEAYLLRARIHLQGRRYLEALLDLDQAELLGGEDRRSVLYHRAVALLGLGQPVRAEDDLDRLLAIDATAGSGYRLRGKAREEQGKLEGALSDYRQALRARWSGRNPTMEGEIKRSIERVRKKLGR